jgi:hypothetical protein
VVYLWEWKIQGMSRATHTLATPLSITRIIQSLYYSPASRCINSSSESADRGRSIIQVTLSSIPMKKPNKICAIYGNDSPRLFFVDYIDRKLPGCFWFVHVPKLKYQAAVNWKFRQRANPYKSKKITIHFSNCEYIDHSTYTQLCRVL